MIHRARLGQYERQPPYESRLFLQRGYQLSTDPTVPPAVPPAQPLPVPDPDPPPTDAEKNIFNRVLAWQARHAGAWLVAQGWLSPKMLAVIAAGIALLLGVGGTAGHLLTRRAVPVDPAPEPVVAAIQQLGKDQAKGFADLGAATSKGFTDLKAWIDVPPTPPTPPPGPDPPTPNPDKAHPVVLPVEVKADVGRMTKLTGKSLADITWLIPPETVAMVDVHIAGNAVLLTPTKDGTFSIGAVCIADKGISSPVWARIIAGKGPMPPPPPPPPPGPDPKPSPAPIPVIGNRCLIVYETADLAKMPAAQMQIIYSKLVRDYLNSKCVLGADGKTKEWRMWDQNVSVGAESKLWQDAMARSRTSVPWLIVSTGNSGVEMPLPANVDETMKILKQHFGE